MNSNARGRDQQMIIMQETEEGMESRRNAITTTTTNRMRARKKDRVGSMQSPAGNTMENTFGANVHSIRRVTITKVTTGEIITTILTEEIREVKEIQRGLHQVPIHASSMKMET